MTTGMFGTGQGAARRVIAVSVLALAAAIAGGTGAQENPPPAPAPGAIIDLRLPPGDDGRTPGVQGPSNNGLPPADPGERSAQQPSPPLGPSPSSAQQLPRTAPGQNSSTSTTTPPATPSPTRPPTAAPTPAPAPAPAPARSEPADSAPTVLEPVATGSSSDARVAERLPPAAVVENVDPATPGTRNAAPLTIEDDEGPPLWGWLLALMAAVGAGFLYWRRRPALEVGAGPKTGTAAISHDRERESDPAPPRPAAPKIPSAIPRTPPSSPVPAAPPPPMAPPITPPPTATTPAAPPLVNRPAAERRAFLSLALEILAIRFTPENIAISFALNLANQGSVAAEGVLVRIALQQGSAMPEPVLARFFDGAGGSIMRDDLILEAGAGEELRTEVLLPRATVDPLVIAGKPMLVPVLAFDVTYHWEGAGDAFGQIAGSFVVGRENAGGGDKLAPLPLDRQSFIVERPGARATAIRRSR